MLLFSKQGAESPLDPQLYANEWSLERFTTVSKALAMLLNGSILEQAEEWYQGANSSS